MLNIVLFGAPGCGKGTQSELLEQKYGLRHVSTGDVIRKQIAAGTPLGLEMKDYINRGELAPDSIVVDMIKEFLATQQEGKGTIFDGFPRTTSQAVEFDRILGEINEQVDVMIYMAVPEEELVSRILKRGIVSGRADDQSEDIIRNRISIYNRQTAIVADYYRAQGKYVEVPSTGTIDDVFARISAVVDKRIR